MQLIISKYIEITKPRITMLVLVTTYLGYYLGLRSQNYHMISWDSWVQLLFLLIGTWATSASAAVLNQVLERKYDAVMNRTKGRPIVTGIISLYHAIYFGITLGVFGVIFLYILINPLTALISFITIFLYLFIYTPSKRFSVLNTIVGSIPGALPPVGGWAAATGSLSAPAWILFGILFCWQMPHFLAIAIIYASDYDRGGFKMLPNVYPESKRTSYTILFFTIALIVTSLGLYIIKVAGIFYAISAAILGILLFIVACQVMLNSSKKNAHRLMFASIIYLPILLIIILVERFLV